MSREFKSIITFIPLGIMKKVYVLFTGLLFSLFIAGTTHAQGIYVKFTNFNDVILTDNVNPGAGTAKDVSKTIDLSDYMKVSSMQYSTEQTLNIGLQSSGAGAGKITFEDLSFTKIVDLASTKLMQIQASGTPMKTVEIVFIKGTGKDANVLYKIVLGTAAVRTFAASSVGDCEGGCPGIAESFSLQYGTLQVYTYAQKADGTIVQNPNPFGWDRIKNVAL